MKTLLALLLFAVSAFAETFVIEVSGTLDSGNESGFFGPEIAQPFSLSITYDSILSAEDFDPSPLIGRYWGGRLTYDVGGTHFETTDSEIRIYCGESGFWGFTFGNRFEFEQNGLTVTEYFGTYASFIQPFTAAVTPTDSLDWLNASQSNPINEASSYSYVHGLTDSGESLRFQQTGDLTYSVRPIPEPATWILCLLSFALFCPRHP